jgi:hypothetical protein
MGLPPPRRKPIVTIIAAIRNQALLKTMPRSFERDAAPMAEGCQEMIPLSRYAHRVPAARRLPLPGRPIDCHGFPGPAVRITAISD